MQTLRYATKSTHTHTYILASVSWTLHSCVCMCVCVCEQHRYTCSHCVASWCCCYKRRILNWRFEGQTNTLSTHAHIQSHTPTHTHTWLRCNCAWKLSRTRIYARLQLWYKILAKLDQKKKVSKTNVNYTKGRVRERDRDREGDRLTVCHMCRYIVWHTGHIKVERACLNIYVNVPRAKHEGRKRLRPVRDDLDWL